MKKVIIFTFWVLSACQPQTISFDSNVPQGSRIATSNNPVLAYTSVGAGSIYLYDAIENIQELILRDNNDGFFSNLMWSPDGQHLMFRYDKWGFERRNGGNYLYFNYVGIYEYDLNANVATLFMDAPAYSLRWSPEGNNLAYLNQEFNLNILNMQSQETTSIAVAFHDYLVGSPQSDWPRYQYPIAWYSNNIVIAGSRNVIQFIDINRHTIIYEYKLAGSTFSDVAWSPSLNVLLICVSLSDSTQNNGECGLYSIPESVLIDGIGNLIALGETSPFYMPDGRFRDFSSSDWFAITDDSSILYIQNIEAGFQSIWWESYEGRVDNVLRFAWRPQIATNIPRGQNRP